MSKVYPGLSDEDSHNCYTYNIRIINVKMKVKFQCRMKIQYDGQSLTNQVPSTEASLFLFNQQCALVKKQNIENHFALSISLVTNKGAKYIAGIAYLYYRELARAADTGPSSRVVVALSKCLDSQAILQIVVNDAFKNGRKQTNSPPRQMSKAKINKLAINTKIDYSQVQAWKIPQNSPTNSPRAYEIKTFQSATQSQVNLNRGLSKNYQMLRNKQKKSRSKSKSKYSVLNYNQEKTIAQSVGSGFNKNFGAYTERSMVNLNNIEQKGEDKSLMYKQSYSKLKEKLKKREQLTQKEHEKRLSLQNSETTVKIEALKYKLKCQELEKNVNDKNGNIKKLQSKLQELEKLLRGQLTDSNLMITKNIQMNSTKTLFNSQIMGARGSTGTENQSGIAVLQTKVAMANKELEQLKSKMQKMQKSQQQKQISYIKQLEKKDKRISKLQEQAFEHEKTSSTGRKAQQSIKMTIQLKNKKIQELQQEHNDVCRKLMEEQKNSKRFQKYVMDMQSKIEQFNRTLNINNLEREKLKQQIEQQRNKRNGAELVCTGLKKTIETLENQIENYKKIKQKYHDILVDCKRIEGQHKLEIKNFESMIKAGQNNSQKLQNKYKQQINMNNKKYQQLQAINLNQKMRIKELQQYTTTALKAEIENYKKNNERLQKQCQEYRNRQRMSKKQYINYESKIGQTNSELEVWKNKHKSLQNVFKLEQDKNQNQITRLKSNLQKELFTQLRQKEKIQKLSSEHNSLINKYERLQQKYQKQTKQLEQKVHQLSREVQKLEDSLKKQQQMNVQHKDKSKQLQNRIKQFGSNEQQYNHIIDKYQAQLSKIKIYLLQVEQKLGNKCRQYDQLNQNYKQVTDKYNNLNSKFQQISYELKAKSSQLERQEKQKQKIQLELINAKVLIQSKDKTIEAQKTNIIDQALLKKQVNDQMIALKTNLENILNDYETFRLQIYDTLVGEYTGVDGLQSLATFVIKGKDFSYGLKQSITRYATEHGYPNQRNSQRNYPSQQTKTSKSMSMKALHGNNNKQVNPISQTGQTNISNNDVISSMNQYTKQSKALLNKMIEQYRILEKQLDYTKQNYQQKQMRLKQQVKKSEMNLQRYEQQLGRVFEEKQNVEKQARQTKERLQIQLSKTREELEKKKQEIQQLKFTSSSLKMQKQNQEEYYEIKTNKLSIKINKLQQSLATLNRSNQDVQLQLSKNKIELERIQSQNKKYKEQLSHKLNKISILQADLNKYTSLSDELTGKVKGMTKQMGELELMLSLERQKNNKNLQQLTEQQKRIMETKQLVSNLLKQKEAMVKQQTENGKKIVELQEIKLYHQRELEQVRTKIQQKTSQLQKQKQQIRKSNKQLKQLETQFSKEKQDRNKLMDELKNKQKEIIVLKDNTRNKQQRYTQQIDKKNKQIVQLNNNKQYVQKTYAQQVRNLNHELDKQREKNTEREQKLKLLNNALEGYQKQLLERSQNIEQKVYQINSYKQVQQKIKRIKQNQQLSIEQLNQQIRQKQEQFYNLSGQFYSLEQKYHQNLMQHKVDIEKLEEEYDYKYDSMCEDYETRIDELQKQKEYLKQKLVISQQEINKNNKKIRQMEEEQARQRTTNKEKLIKIEEQKNIIINNLKAEIKKHNDLREKTQNQIKKKEVEIQRQKNLEESDKNIIKKLQQKLKEIQTKMEQMQQQCYNQAQDSRRKQMHMKQYEQSIKSYQWVLQREIKKQLQNITKFIIVNSESSENKKKMTDIIKDIQSRITKLVSDKIPHHPNN